MSEVVLQAGDTIRSELFLLINPQMGTSRGGAPYLRCLLGNRAGRAAGRCWSFDAARMQLLEDAPVVRVDGEVVEWQGKPQINIESVEAVEADAETLASLLPQTSGNVPTMFRQVRSLLDTITEPTLKALAEAFLDDQPLMDRFCQSPAGVSMHHACIGGLLEHTLSVMQLAAATVEHYQSSDTPLQGDLLLMGAFVHDLGKTDELDWSRGFTYTTDGKLVGHIVRGSIMIEDKAGEVAMTGGEIDEDIVRHLQHLVLSHHERPEYGAAREPSTPEAHTLAMLDRLDATLHLNR
ncbi:MAG: HD domain-containing protein [Phycisphaerales bacterium]|nr:HD domain-containing protein [Phycisphaerales bacterium]